MTIKPKSAGKVVCWARRWLSAIDSPWTYPDLVFYRSRDEAEKTLKTLPNYVKSIELVRVTIEPWPKPKKPKKRRKQIVYGKNK